MGFPNKAPAPSLMRLRCRTPAVTFVSALALGAAAPALADDPDFSSDSASLDASLTVGNPISVTTDGNIVWEEPILPGEGPYYPPDAGGGDEPVLIDVTGASQEEYTLELGGDYVEDEADNIVTLELENGGDETLDLELSTSWSFGSNLTLDEDGEDEQSVDWSDNGLTVPEDQPSGTYSAEVEVIASYAD